MRFTINSRNHGEVEFSRPGAHYIYVDLNGAPGTLGDQICYGGKLTGGTLGYGGDSKKYFEKVCRRWWNNYLRRIREEKNGGLYK